MTPVSDNPIVLGAFVVLLVLAALQDLRSLRISNFFAVGVLIVSLIAVGMAEPVLQWWRYLASFALVLVVGVLLFTRGWLGGGDVKLFAASAAAFSLSNLLWFVSAVTIIGGVLTLTLIILRTFVSRRFLAIGNFQGLQPGASIPYGVAITVGAIIAATVTFPGSAEPELSIPSLESLSEAAPTE